MFSVTASAESVISIHALVKRATLDLQEKKKGAAYFNPRPREEGDCRCVRCSFRKNISIHALVKRATAFSIRSTNTNSISIHALVKRATASVMFSVTASAISIHALVKRATYLTIIL